MRNIINLLTGAVTGVIFRDSRTENLELSEGGLISLSNLQVPAGTTPEGASRRPLGFLSPALYHLRGKSNT